MRFVFTIVLTGLLMVGASTASRADSGLLGAGATFPYPLYSKMFDVYHKEYGVRVNYQSIGSGGGIRQLLNKTVDFGASDAFMSDEEMKKSPYKILHIPICLGAVVVTYNLPGSPEIKLTPDIISNIFLGKITRWDDFRIKKVNPGFRLPAMKIIVAHRSDGSGTTFIFTDYLSKVSSEWEKKVGRGKAVNWPLGLGGKGNAGVAGLVKQIPGSIGYVEMVYALQSNMPAAIIENKKGNFIKASIKSTSLAANVELPPDTRVSLTNTDSEFGYPISGFTWILVYKEQNYDSRSQKKAKVLVNLLWWMTHQGQKYAEGLGYAPLPDEAVKKAEKIIKSITYQGRPIRRN